MVLVVVLVVLVVWVVLVLLVVLLVVVLLVLRDCNALGLEDTLYFARGGSRGGAVVG